MVADASIAKARNPSPDLEGENDFAAVLPVGPLVALAESPTPLTWDRTVSILEPLDLGMDVASHDQGAQDREGVPHDDIRSASIHLFDELFDVQEEEGLGDRVVQEGPDRSQAACMRHLDHRGQELLWLASIVGIESRAPSSCWSGASRCTPRPESGDVPRRFCPREIQPSLVGRVIGVLKGCLRQGGD